MMQENLWATLVGIYDREITFVPPRNKNLTKSTKHLGFRLQAVYLLGS